MTMQQQWGLRSVVKRVEHGQLFGEPVTLDVAAGVVDFCWCSCLLWRVMLHRLVLLFVVGWHELSTCVLLPAMLVPYLPVAMRGSGIHAAVALPSKIGLGLFAVDCAVSTITGMHAYV